jgi:FlaG/FlaF family flagellin (archaellin)
MSDTDGQRNNSETDLITPSRAQSEVVGVVILVGVFATVATIAGVVLIQNTTDQVSDEPLAEIDATATNDSGTVNVSLTHAGGDDLAADEVAVILRQNDELREGLDTYNGSGDEFTPGETRWKRQPALSPNRSLRVIVVHEPSNGVLLDTAIDVG